MLSRDDGKISKTLTLQPLGDKGDWYLGLDVKDAAIKENSIKLGLPLTGGELHTIKALSEVGTPHFLATLLTQRPYEVVTSLGACHPPDSI